MTSAVTKGTLKLSDSVLSKIKEHFTTDQQQMFVQSFQAYLKYDPVKDFVVNLEEVYEWIGFARKDNAKKLLVNKFQKEVDFTIFRRSAENTKGRKEEVIMLNTNTFKKLCLKADTKKGDEIQDLYVAMERVLHEVIAEENNQKVLMLEEQLKEREERIQAIEAAQPVYEEVLKTGHVYVLSTDKPGTFKVGRSKNEVKKRVSQLQTAVVDDIKIEYDFPTSNEILLESIMHFVLDRYRTNYNREHFSCRKAYIITLLKIAGNNLDTLKSTYQKIEMQDILDKIADKIDEEVVAIEETDSESSPQPPAGAKTLFCYLTENAAYKEGASTPLSLIRDKLSQWIGTEVKKLDKDTFFQVNRDFVVESIHICKSCGEAHKKGCCDCYNKTNRTTKQIVRNLELIE